MNALSAYLEFESGSAVSTPRFTSNSRLREVPKNRAHDRGNQRHRPATASIVRIHLLGSMRATSYLGDNILPRGRKARAILGCLCLAGGRARAAQPARRDAVGPRAGLSGPRQLPPGVSRAHRRVRAARRRTDLRRSRDHQAQYRSCAGSMRSRCWRPSPANSPRSDLAALCTGELLEELDGLSVSFDQWLLASASHFTERLRALLEAELQQAHRRTVRCERARRHCAPPDPLRSDPRRRLAHPDARACRHGRARAGAARIRALPRGAEA